MMDGTLYDELHHAASGLCCHACLLHQAGASLSSHVVSDRDDTLKTDTGDGKGRTLRQEIAESCCVLSVIWLLRL